MKKNKFVYFIIFQILLIGVIGFLGFMIISKSPQTFFGDAPTPQPQVNGADLQRASIYLQVALLVLGISGVIDLILVVLHIVKQYSQGKFKSKSYLAFIVLVGAFVLYCATVLPQLDKIGFLDFLIGIFVFVTLFLVVFYLSQKSRR
jgi:hypothetical protein